MNREALTGAAGRIWGASAQRWGLIVVAVTAALGASVASGPNGGHLALPLTAVVLVVAVLAVVVPDSHFASAASLVVVLQWLLEDGGFVSGWALAGAAALVVFHLAVALMAAVPANAIIPWSALVPWCRRGVVVAAATVVAWGVAAVVDGRSVAGSAAVALAALVGLTLVVVAVAALSAEIRATKAVEPPVR